MNWLYWQTMCMQAGVLVNFVLTTALASIANIDPACITAGFTSSLTCTSCEDLARFKLNGLYDQCAACCRRDEAVVKKYPFANLEVCN